VNPILETKPESYSCPGQSLLLSTVQGDRWRRLLIHPDLFAQTDLRLFVCVTNSSVAPKPFSFASIVQQSRHEIPEAPASSPFAILTGATPWIVQQTTAPSESVWGAPFCRLPASPNLETDCRDRSSWTQGERFDYLTMDDEDHYLLSAHLGPEFCM